MSEARIHARDADGRLLCAAESQVAARWSSAVLHSNTNAGRVTCRRCQQRLASA